MNEYVERAKVENWLLTECASLDTQVDRECVVERMREDIPAADVRSVVLCKDCRHRDPEDHKCDSGESERQGCPFKVADDYFCAYGER